MIKISDILVGIPDNAVFTGTGGVLFPAGSCSQRPLTPLPFTFRYSSDLKALEVWNAETVRWETVVTTYTNQHADYRFIGEIHYGILDYGIVTEIANDYTDLGYIDNHDYIDLGYIS